LFALVFGYAQKEDGSLDDQTKDRCLKGAELYKKGKVGKIYLTVSAEKSGKAMADEMANFIQGQGIARRDIHIIRQGGNTAGEMDVFLTDLLVNYGRIREIFFVSSWYHIPRIVWLASRRMLWKNFSIKVAWSHVHFVGDFLMEFAKMANALLWPIKSAKILKTPLV
jgi:uncharacterized SAM-binding protein YcdF (DUF218 family)